MWHSSWSQTQTNRVHEKTSHQRHRHGKKKELSELLETNRCHIHTSNYKLPLNDLKLTAVMWLFVYRNNSTTFVMRSSVSMWICSWRQKPSKCNVVLVIHDKSAGTRKIRHRPISDLGVTLQKTPPLTRNINMGRTATAKVATMLEWQRTNHLTE